jgi:tRNA (guanine-N7-)-methyltransferase
MGRRALRKIDPNLDLSRYLKTLDQLPSPWDAAALFGRAAPLEVEVGSGKGLFLLSAAQAQPEVNFLGIEISPRYAAFCAARLARRQIPNAVVVSGDAKRVFSDKLPDSSLAAVHVYFPDPWWKSRHLKRRLMAQGFVRDVARVLQPGGMLHFWTDVETYFQVTLELIRTCTPLQGPFPVEERAPQHDLDYQTNFERRVRQAGGIVYRAIFVKQAADDRQQPLGHNTRPTGNS